MIALLFPGQGTQKIGMLSPFVNAFPCTKQTLDEIEDATSFKILELTENGSLDELSRTENAQLAIFTAGMLCLSVLGHEYGFDLKNQCKYLAGHSLGEYTALCASGVFSLHDASKLVRKRGELMASACENAENYLMSAILGITVAEIESVIAEYHANAETCVIANDNSNSQVVLSGYKYAVRHTVEKIIKRYPHVKAIDLNTSGAFHSPLMGSATIALDEYLASESVVFNDFSVPVVSNVTAIPMADKNAVGNELVRQMVSRVKWRETVELIVGDNEIDKIVEIAPGRVLSNMIKRDYKDRTIISLDTMNQIEEFMKG